MSSPKGKPTKRICTLCDSEGITIIRLWATMSKWGNWEKMLKRRKKCLGKEKSMKKRIAFWKKKWKNSKPDTEYSWCYVAKEHVWKETKLVAGSQKPISSRHRDVRTYSSGDRSPEKGTRSLQPRIRGPTEKGTRKTLHLSGENVNSQHERLQSYYQPNALRIQKPECAEDDGE